MSHPLYAPPRTAAQLVPDGTYTIRRPFFSFLDRTFRVMDAEGRLVALVRHPLLKLREQFQIFADEARTQPIATVQARQMIALNFTYDVTDPQTGGWLGTLRSRGLKSIIRDTWDALDQHEQPIGVLEEEGLSWLRRVFPILLGHWRIDLNGTTAARVDQVFRFFVKEYRLTVHADGQDVDTRFLLSCALLALMRENRRESSN
jgi:hypothetical protein